MKRNPSAATIIIRPTSLWSALVASSIQRGAAAGEVVDDKLGAGRALMALLRFRSGPRPVLGGLDVGLLAADEVFVFLGRDHVDLGPHRRVGLAGEGRRLAVVDAFFVGAEDDVVVLPGTASRLPDSSGTSQVWTTSVETRSSSTVVSTGTTRL